MTIAYETIVLTAPAAGVILVTLDRPQAANAFNTRMALELTEAFLALRDERCVILTGAGAVRTMVS